MAEAVSVPAQLGATRVPESQATASPSHSTLTGAELPQAKKSCVCAHRVASVVSDSLRPCRLWPARLLCQGWGFSRQESWSILANTGCHPLLKHCISCCRSCQLPLSTWCCQNPCDPSSCTTSTPGPHRGKPKSSRAASGANPSGRPTCRGGNKTTIETQGQCG